MLSVRLSYLTKINVSKSINSLLRGLPFWNMSGQKFCTFEWEFFSHHLPQVDCHNTDKRKKMADHEVVYIIGVLLIATL